MLPPNQIDLLIADDDEEYRATVVRRLARRGYQVQEAANGRDALATAERRQFDVAILDMVMPDMTGIEVLEKLKASQSECEVILLTGQGTIETAVQAMKLGAYDYLTKPCPLAELEVLVEKAVERRQLSKENTQLRAVLGRSQATSEIIGSSPAMLELFRLIDRAGPTEKARRVRKPNATASSV